MSLNPISAQMLLLKCCGDEIWSIETCRERGVPEEWIDELHDCFESGFDTNRNTIYVDSGGTDFASGERMVNQYEGVLDLMLAYKLAEYLGIDWERETAFSLGRRAEVDALKNALDEL